MMNKTKYVNSFINTNTNAFMDKLFLRFGYKGNQLHDNKKENESIN